MRTILMLLLFVICILLMIGIYIQQPRLFGDTPMVVNSTVSSIITPDVTKPVIDLQTYKSTQTAVATRSIQPVPTAPAVMHTATVALNQIANAQTPTIKPVRLPQTGSVDSSDIWSNTPILLLIGGCITISLGLWWQSRRTIK